MHVEIDKSGTNMLRHFCVIGFTFSCNLRARDGEFS